MFGVFWHGIVLIGMVWYALECILSIIVKFWYFSGNVLVKLKFKFSAAELELGLKLVRGERI